MKSPKGITASGKENGSMTSLYAVIGGSGFYRLGDDFIVEQAAIIDTPYGATSAEVIRGVWQGQPVVFLARHGEAHRIPPHRINYRANLFALKQQGVSHVIAVNAVGGISSDYAPETIALPDQIIDYSWGRAHSFCDGETGEVQHIDFTYPYSGALRSMMAESAVEMGLNILQSGVYGCTNGPRLETKAEIIKMCGDGCDMVGMTGMPEAALARELGIEYASIALVVNWCAGISDSEITMDEIMRVLQRGMAPVKQLILSTLKKAYE
jgi:5'-methylthioinosine phosphorylase